jgi:serine-type D-Ala-D-Ala carboxypeptidase/endopeptidase (penicillin-binding protein 4)
MIRNPFLILSIIILTFVSCAPGVAIREGAGPRGERPEAAATAGRQLDEILDSPAAADAFWGVCIKSLDTGKVFFARNQDKYFTPASNMKLFTTAVALVRLGPEFVYTTNVYAGGDIKNGVLKGNLIIRGSGDPSISASFHDTPTAVFEEWADRIRDAGIREITGHIVGDSTLFNTPGLGHGWAWDDECFSYSARISALSFNDNCFEVVMSPGKNPGDMARIGATSTKEYNVINNVATTQQDREADVHANRPFGSETVRLSGTIPLGSPAQTLRFAVANPALYAASVMKEVLDKKGIKVDGTAKTVDDSGPLPDYSLMRVVASYQSPPLYKIIEQTNKRSQNLYAELLFYTLGLAHGGRSSDDSTLQVMLETLESMGIPRTSISIHDGSGLSRLNLVKPSQIVQVLEYMSRHPSFRYFYQSLPVAGTDGTLMKRMKYTDAENNLRAKTGTLTHTVALSGYIKNREGKNVAFSIMSNNCIKEAREIRQLQDAICERISDL